MQDSSRVAPGAFIFGELRSHGDLLLCVFSREHVFAVDRDAFAAFSDSVLT